MSDVFGIPADLFMFLCIIAVLVVTVLILLLIVRPYMARREALKIKPGDKSADPGRMQPKTNPRYTREEPYVELGENEFLKRD